jgi:hypothetical protein
VTESAGAGERDGAGAGGDPDRLSRLDPDRAAGASPAPPSPPPVIDTRRYRWMIGIFGLVLVAAVSIYEFATHGVGTTGVPPGHRLHYFAAPLANSNLVGDPNLNPPCTAAKHDPRALNLCLDVKRTPLVLAFFVTGSGQCRRSVDALQALSRSGAFSPRSVQFAAVAVEASRSDTAALIRSHHWAIPVAYDRDGSIGSLYGVAVCPMLELAYRGGVVRDRLIGDQWQTAAALAPRVRALVRARPPAS